MSDDGFDLDEIDRGILYLLQENARSNTTTEIGERVGVSATTIGNRISDMEDRGVIEGYEPIIDYEKTGMQLHLLFTCQVPVDERAGLAAEAKEIDGVVTVQEVLTGEENLLVEALSPTASDLTDITRELEDHGVDVKGTEILGPQHIQPFDHFGRQVLEDD